MIINDPYYTDDSRTSVSHDKVTFAFIVLLSMVSFSLITFLLNFS